MKSLLVKEIRSFFSSLLGYVVVSTFLLLTGLFLWIFPGEWNILDGGMATLRPFYAWAPWVLMLLIPAVTMRSFAEENKSGTLETLFTRPLSDGDIICAKFLGAWAVSALALVPTLSYVWVVGVLGSPEWNLDVGAVAGSYLGLLLLSSAWVSLGIWISTWTDNSLVAFLTSVMLSLIIYIGFSALSSFSLLGSWDWWFERLGMQVHYEALSRGRLDSLDVMYFLFLNALFLGLAHFRLQQRHQKRTDHLMSFALRVGIAGGVYWMASSLPFFVDLTAEKRYTLTEATEATLANVQDEVLVTCYLTGENPSAWQRLEREIEEKLIEFSDLSSGQLRYQFVDIYASEDPQTIGENEQNLFEKGMGFTRIAFEQQGAKAFKTLWPAAILTYQGKEVPIQFFRSDSPQPTESMIQGSINAIEFELATALRRAMRKETPKIAFIEGHGELDADEVADWTQALEIDCDVFRVRLDGQLNRLSEKIDGMSRRVNRFDLAIVAKPDSAMDLKDQVILDQFLMNGGKLIWLVDPIATNLDSLAQQSFTLGTTAPLGIYDLLFDYGVRLNRNLVVDLQCAPIMLDVGPNGNQRQYDMFNWYFAPIAMPQGISHPITTNLDPIHFDFVSRLDTTNNQRKVRKTVLLASSEMSRSYKAPVRISSSIVDLTPDYFEQGAEPHQPFAILLEGQFESSFKHRLTETLQQDPDFAFQDSSRTTSMLVVGDGDLCRNKVKIGEKGPMILPLGYDRYAGRVVYDNKDFLMNAVSYLLDDQSTISVRSRAIALRPLNAEKVRKQRVGWQAIAVAVPWFMVLLSGWAMVWFRKRRFAIPS
ncbi:MAG: gliding motility-associated ABC transporter substrate-binding protein GldG [Flavobacteriales bacterium]